MNEAIAFLGRKWKDKYTVSWCHLCGTAAICCPHCFNSSCNGGGCKECADDQKEFNDTIKCRIEDYLSREEIVLYHKIEKLKDFIIKSIQDGETEINFKKLQEDGKLSETTEKLFRKELKNS